MFFMSFIYILSISFIFIWFSFLKRYWNVNPLESPAVWFCQLHPLMLLWIFVLSNISCTFLVQGRGWIRLRRHRKSGCSFCGVTSHQKWLSGSWIMVLKQAEVKWFGKVLQAELGSHKVYSSPLYISDW